MLTLKRVKAVLNKRFGGLLKRGCHTEGGEVCVRELRACALGAKWSDHPDGVYSSATDYACQILNDACWSSDEMRTKSCLKLALLTEADAAPGWVDIYAERVMKEIVRLAMKYAKDAKIIARAATAYAVNQDDATKAAAYASAVSEIALIVADKDANAVLVGARNDAATAVAADRILLFAVKILVECHRGIGA